MMVGTEKAMARILDLARSELHHVESDKHTNALIENTALVSKLQDKIEALRAQLAAMQAYANKRNTAAMDFQEQLAACEKERDANAKCFEAYHELRVAVNTAYPQNPYMLAEDVPAQMQKELADCEKEREKLKEDVEHYKYQAHDAGMLRVQLAACEKDRDELRGTLFQRCCDVAASQHYAKQLRGALQYAYDKFDEEGFDFHVLLQTLALPYDTTALDVLIKDAERYRWLRHGDNDDLVMIVCNKETWLPRNEHLDAAIDKAMNSELTHKE
jgi:hypothetical protein